MDITSTSFGLLIAYLLPGLVTLFGLSYWVPQLRGLINDIPGTSKRQA